MRSSLFNLGGKRQRVISQRGPTSKDKYGGRQCWTQPVSISRTWSPCRRSGTAVKVAGLAAGGEGGAEHPVSRPSPCLPQYRVQRPHQSKMHDDDGGHSADDDRREPEMRRDVAQGEAVTGDEYHRSCDQHPKPVLTFHVFIRGNRGISPAQNARPGNRLRRFLSRSGRLN